MRVFVLNLAIGLFLASALVGCASKTRGSYLILGMDYNDAKAIINVKDGAKLYVREVWRNRAGDKLIIRFVHLDGDKAEKIALIYAGVIKILAPNELQEDVQEVPDRRQNAAIAGLKWAAYFYDKHPETGQLLIQEDRRFMAHSYEYDPATNARKSVGLAREYMLYVTREFAKTLRLQKLHVIVKEPANFTKK